MYLKDYQIKAMNVAKMGTSGDWIYPIMKLSGEASEVLEKIETIYVEKGGRHTEEDRLEIAKELGDVLWYITFIATKLGLTLLMIEGSADDLDLQKNKLEISGLRLAITTGQISERMGKVFRDKGGIPTPEDELYIGKKLAEVYYWTRLITWDYGFTTYDIAEINIEKCEDRSRRDVIHGEGDNR